MNDIVENTIPKRQTLADGNPLTDLKSLLPDEMREFISAIGKEKFRATQILSWIHGHGVVDFDQMSNLSQFFRDELARVAYIERLREVSRVDSGDGTATKLLFELSDGNRVETVVMLDGGRRTVCVSSQVGCAMGCEFCATAQLGLSRNLTSGEIVDQVLQASLFFQHHEKPVTNVVFMGMGEPLQNYDSVVKAIVLLGLEMGLAISAAKITVSTAGLIPRIIKMADEYPRVGLAVSLNATTDEVRSSIMPINKRYPIAELMKAIRSLTGRLGRRRVTFEYVLMDGVNDSIEDARQLLHLTTGIPCKINLIPFNPVPSSEYRRPPLARINEFHQFLSDRNKTVTVRWSRGDDIAAACGQLSGSYRDGDD
jgi:23S rRNA (adenine2503-C2)-methyltransferase